METSTTRLAAERPTVPAGEAGQPPVAAVQPADDATVQRLTAAAVKFEGFFVAQMLKQMRQATAAMADSGSAINDRVNDSTLALAEQTVADGLAGQRAFGIADVLVRQMSPQSGAAVNAAGTRKLS